MPLQVASIPTPSTPIADTNSGIATIIFRKFLELLVSTVNAAVVAINGVPGVNNFTVATQPTLGLTDAGFLGRVTDVDRLVTWDGTAWQTYGGDEAGRLEFFTAAPTGVGWALCDGSSTTLLGVGATLVLTSFTTPNLTATPSYLKSAAAYTGVVAGPSGSTAGGATGTGLTGTGTTSSDNQHNHNITGGSSTFTIGIETVDTTVQSGSGVTVAGAFHTHVVSGHTDDVSAHSHTVPALAVPSLSVPALDVGSLDMAHLNALPYVRR